MGLGQSIKKKRLSIAVRIVRAVWNIIKLGKLEIKRTFNPEIKF